MNANLPRLERQLVARILTRDFPPESTLLYADPTDTVRVEVEKVGVDLTPGYSKKHVVAWMEWTSWAFKSQTQRKEICNQIFQQRCDEDPVYEQELRNFKHPIQMIDSNIDGYVVTITHTSSTNQVLGVEKFVLLNYELGDFEVISQEMREINPPMPIFRLDGKPENLLTDAERLFPPGTYIGVSV